MIKKEIPAEKIIKIDQLLAKYDYSPVERGKTESIYANIKYNEETMGKKLNSIKTSN